MAYWKLHTDSGKPKFWERNPVPVLICPLKNPTWKDVAWNPRLNDDRPASNSPQNSVRHGVFHPKAHETF